MKFRNKKKFRYGIPASADQIRALVGCDRAASEVKEKWGGGNSID
jgi:hypothetical protein